MYESPGPQWILDSTLWIPDCVAEKRSVFSVRESLFVSFSFNGNTSRISSAWWKVITSVCSVINRVIGKCLFSRLRYGFVCILLKVGEQQTVLITEDSKDGVHFVGHNKFYDQVSDWNQCAPVLPFFLLFFNLKFCRLKDNHVLAIVNNASPLKRKVWRKCETESGTWENHTVRVSCSRIHANGASEQRVWLANWLFRSVNLLNYTKEFYAHCQETDLPCMSLMNAVKSAFQ